MSLYIFPDTTLLGTTNTWTQTQNFSVSPVMKATSANEGGELILEKPTGSSLAGSTYIDMYTSIFRVFEGGGDVRGIQIDLASLPAGQHTIWTAGNDGPLSGLDADTVDTYHVGTSGATIPLCNTGNTFSGITTFSALVSTFGSNTGSATYGLGSGATTNGNTKTVNIGTGGVAGSTTNVNIGSINSNSNTTVYGTVKLSYDTPSVGGVMPGATQYFEPQAAILLASVSADVTTNVFTCAAASLSVNQPIVLTGTNTGALITGYTNPTTYYIISTNGSTTFSLSTTVAGASVDVTGTSGSTNLIFSTATGATAYGFNSPFVSGQTFYAGGTVPYLWLSGGANANSFISVSTANNAYAWSFSSTGVFTAPGQIVSNAAQGTAPLSVASTTLVTNLNADLLDGLNTSSSDTSGNSVVIRSGGNFSAGTITATLSGNSSTTSRVLVPDTRAVVTTPETLATPGVVFDFKSNTSSSLTDGGTYHGLMTFRPYGLAADWSGGPSHQLGFTGNGNVYHRSGSTTTWGGWSKLWDEGNDGSGSGLDADLLDGNHINQFLSVNGTDTTTADFPVGAYIGFNAYYDGVDARWETKTAQDGAFAFRNSGSGVGFQFFIQDGPVTAGGLFTYNTYSLRDGDFFSGTNKFWHAGNDGSGSLLDADKLDNLESTQFVRNDVVGQEVQSYLTINTNSGYAVLEFEDAANVQRTHAFFDTAQNLFGIGVFDAAGANRKDLYLYQNGSITWNGNTVWHAGNDGSGSGLDADLLDGRHLDTLTATLRSNRAIHGGGTVTVSAAGRVSWSSRFIVISNGRGAHFSTNGYFDINCPTSGTITGVGGATDVTATAEGILLGSWQAIYYILPIGSAHTFIAANLRVVDFASALTIPDDWVLVCGRNGDNARFYFNNGLNLAAGQSINTATYDAYNASLLNGYAVGTSGTSIPLLSGSNTFSGANTFSNGAKLGPSAQPTFKVNIEFGDVANTWRRLIVASLVNTNYSTIGFKIRITDPNTNYAPPASVNADFETYMVACVRTEATTLDTPDLCVVRGPGNRIRAVKTSVGNYEIQIQNEAQYTEYFIEVDCYAVEGAHTITYENGSTIGTAGIATYNASVGASIFFTEKLTAKGSITADAGATFTAGQTVAFNNTTGTAPFTVASTTQVTNLNASQLAGNSIGTSGAAIPLLNGTNTFSGNTTFSNSTSTFGSNTGNATYNLGTGNTIAGNTKNINIGTGGVSTSTTNISIGSFTSNTTTYIYGALEVLAAQTGGAASNAIIKIYSKDFPVVPATITQENYLTAPRLIINSGTNTSSFVSIQSANSAYTWTFNNAGIFSTGQIQSNVTTGTAPFTISSTTAVTNLNADLLDGNHATAFMSSGATTFAGDATNRADITTRVETGFYEYNAGTTALGWPVDTNSWQHLIAVTHSNDTNYYSMQLAGSFYNSDLYQRTTAGSGTTAWNKIWTSGNDGPLSGLDADTVDSYHVGTSGATIPLFNGTNSWSGTQSFLTGLRLNTTTTVDGAYNGTGISLQSHAISAAGAGYTIGMWALSAAAGGALEFIKSRAAGGVIGVAGVVANGDTLGRIVGSGYNSTPSIVRSAEIAFVVSGTPTASSVPSKIEFLTSGTTGTATSRVEIGPTGLLSALNGLTVTGVAQAASSTGTADATALLQANNGSVSVGIIPKAAAGSYNGSVVANDSVIVVTDTTAGVGNNVLNIVPWSNNASGIRMSTVGSNTNISLQAVTTSIIGTLSVDNGLKLFDNGANYLTIVSNSALTTARTVTLDFNNATRTITFPGTIALTLVGTSQSQTLTNKTINSASNTILGTATAIAAATTLSAAQVQGGLIVTTATPYTVTLPTGTTLDTITTTTDAWLELNFANAGGSALTIAINTGVSSVGSLTVSAASGGRFILRRTSTAATWVAYRI